MNDVFSKADIIILGAGPAGCAASIQACKAGLRVLMFEANSKPKRAPGETLHPGLEPILNQLGVFEKVKSLAGRRHQGISMNLGGSQHFSPYGEDKHGPWQGFQVDRQLFHEVLQEAAIHGGATLIRGTSPTRLLKNTGKVSGIIVGNREFRATYVADATGRSAWLAQQLKLPTKRFSPSLGVQFGWRNGVSQRLKGLPAFSFQKHGWHWEAPVSADATAWVTLRIGKPGEMPPGIDMTWRIREACAGPGYFLLGDAAYVLDPSSSHGVLKALMSGIYVSHLIEAQIKKDIPDHLIISDYISWVNQQFHADEKNLRQLYLSSPARKRFEEGEFSTAI